MATCYRCGVPNANYRRTTYTGYSSGTWWSKRSYGAGSRTYYGVRSVCQDCARTIDRGNTIRFIFKIAIGAIIAIFFFNHFSSSSRRDSSSKKAASYQYSGQTAKVASTKGLNLRDQPGSSGTVLLTVPYNETVGVIDKNGDSETIAGKTANWYKVDYKGTIGWLWSGYLQ
ncbi:SH3 domain-containing protein [Dawidia soli]|uniref:SH3 domain-containing protein n=1 Tax=Dawidia soli TaxID=2782352 RepID=A0AAP2D4G2_9BACT|nr:SH3 domain-containing protein [Dawidia soli]